MSQLSCYCAVIVDCRCRCSNTAPSSTGLFSGSMTNPAAAQAPEIPASAMRQLLWKPCSNGL